MNTNATGAGRWAAWVCVVAASANLLLRPILAADAVAVLKVATVGCAADGDREELAYHSRFYRMLRCKAQNLRLSEEQLRRIGELEQSTVDGIGWLRQLHAIDEMLPRSAENPHAMQRATLIQYFDQILTDEILEQGQAEVLIWGC